MKQTSPLLFENSIKSQETLHLTSDRKKKQ